MSSVTIRTKRLLRNPLLQRRQFVVEVLHPGKAGVSIADITEKLMEMHKVGNKQLVFLFGFRIAFGGGKSTGFGLIYDDLDAANQFEPKHRLVRNGLGKKVEKSRKSIKEDKNRKKKIWGTGRAVALHKAKKAAKNG